MFATVGWFNWINGNCYTADNLDYGVKCTIFQNEGRNYIANKWDFCPGSLKLHSNKLGWLYNKLF